MRLSPMAGMQQSNKHSVESGGLVRVGTQKSDGTMVLGMPAVQFYMIVAVIALLLVILAVGVSQRMRRVPDTHVR